MATNPAWPEPAKSSLLGKRISRLDGPAKTRGEARYTYDRRRSGMLWGAVARCPHARARITALDVSAAAKMPGVRAVHAVKKVGDEVKWALDEIVYVAAATEAQAHDAARAVKVAYEVLPATVVDDDPKAAGAKEQNPSVQGDPDGRLAASKVSIEGTYGLPVVAHLCLEAHGQLVEWDGDALTAWCSTQSVSGLPGEFAEGLDVPASKVRVICEHMGGGFGSKFSVDAWGIACAELARKAKAPVKLMLDRAAEIAVAGDRPSTYATVKAGADADGRVTGWSSRSWGSGGLGGSGSPPIPYVFNFPDRRHQHVSIPTHTASSRAWRAPNHPQACLVTMAALDDLAAAAGMDPLELFLRNLDRTAREATYREQFRIGAELMEWKKKWRPRGSAKGAVRRGLGLSLHTWGGRGHRSNCDVVVNPDGSVEARIASQDLGTGTRTVIGVVLAETFGLPLSAVKVSIGDSTFPTSGASGGSTTVGGVSGSTRAAAVKALDAIFEKVAPELGVAADALEAVGGAIRVKGNAAKAMPWKNAAARLGATPLTVRGERPEPLTDSGVGGIQMAEVEVDVDTGLVRMVKMVAVQDCGRIVDLKTAESQVYGGMIMGIGYALTEEKVYDRATGRPLNADMEFYRIPTIGDVGELVVHLQTGPPHDARGVIGLGEPPVISPGAAISNAVANAIGVRVPRLPLTPDRVIAALDAAGRKAPA